VLSIRWRLTIFHALAILGIAGLLLAILFVVMYRGVSASVEETVQARAGQTAQLLYRQPLRGPDDPNLAPLGDDGVYIAIRDAQGRVIATAGTPPKGFGKVTDGDRTGLWREAVTTGRPAERREHELFGYATAIAAAPGGARVVELWKSYDEEADRIVPFLPVVSILVPVGVVLALLGSWLLAWSALRPVDAVVRAAREIGEEDLSRRLPVRNPRDELGRLALTFNDLLARLERAFRDREAALTRQRRFTADASHELRTPLTSILGYTRILRTWGGGDPAVAQESLEALERDARRMHGLVEALLLLAKGDEPPVSRPERVDLRDVAREVGVAARAAAAGVVAIELRLAPTPVIALVDPDAAHRALAILVDNAIKFSQGLPHPGEVRVAARDVPAGGTELVVEDNGVGITPREQEAIFDRFYRVDQARTMPGAGLGLAIARQVMERAGGRLTVRSVRGEGATFALWFPPDSQDLTKPPPHAADGDGAS
jgi:signal transduction histidine kinase